MKKIAYLIIPIYLLVSCANKEARSEMYKVVSDKKEVEQVKTEQFLNEKRTKQKLQDYYDLLILQQKNPEFKEDILVQLQKIATVKKKVSDTNMVQIQNLNLLGNIQKISDTIHKMKITYDRVSVNTIKNDTINVIITTKKVTIDGREFVSSKIRFLEK